MYLLFALILYLKSQGITVAWWWYILAIFEAIDTTHKKIEIYKGNKDENK